MTEPAETALDQYDLVPPVHLFHLPAQGNSNTALGVETGGGDFVLKVFTGYDNLQRLEGEHALLAWLHDQNLSFAVPVPIATRQGSMVAQSGLGWQSLTRLFPGSRVNPADERDLEAFGGALGELLSAFECVPSSIAPHSAGDFQVIVPRMPDLAFDVTAVGLDDTRDHRALREWLDHELIDLRRFVSAGYQDLPRQMTHNDFIPSNVLAHDGRVTAVLDFEFATHGIRALDFAMALLFCLRYWTDADLLRTAMVLSRGFARTNGLTTAEIDALPQLLRLRNMASTLWWLGRTLPSGVGPDEVLRIERTREFAGWLAERDQDLVAAVSSGLS